MSVLCSISYLTPSSDHDLVNRQLLKVWLCEVKTPQVKKQSQQGDRLLGTQFQVKAVVLAGVHSKVAWFLPPEIEEAVPFPMVIVTSTKCA